MKRASGRLRNPTIPPSISQTAVKQRVILTAADLTGLAATAGLRLALDGPTLDDVASNLSRLLGEYVLWKRMERSGAPLSDVRIWAGSLARLARDTVTVLRGNSAMPHDLDTSESDIFPGSWHLATRGLAVTADDPKHVESIARLLHLAGAATLPVDAQSVEAVQLAITRTVYSLSALAILADRTVDHAASEAKLLQSLGRAEPQKRTRRATKTGGSEPQKSRHDLFLGLASNFEELHSDRKYAVSKYPNRGEGQREALSAGPAVIWTRELFKLAADPQRARPLGSPILELVELYAWSRERPEGFAKRIEEAGQKHRKTPRSEAGG